MTIRAVPGNDVRISIDLKGVKAKVWLSHEIEVEVRKYADNDFDLWIMGDDEEKHRYSDNYVAVRMNVEQLTQLRDLLNEKLEGKE